MVYGGPNTGGQKIGISNATSNFGTTSVVVQNSNVKAVGGSTAVALRNANNGGATIQNSSLLATGGYAIYRVNGQINVAASELDGLGSPGLTCVASYKADFTALGNTCT